MNVLQSNFVESRSFQDRLKLVLSGISGAFILPISTLFLVSIFLSIGSYLEHFSSLRRFGFAIKSLSFPLLQTIPLLFCVAFSISFCKGDATCIWGSIISYLVFISVQSAFIWQETNGQGYTILFSSLGRSPKSMAFLVDQTLGIRSLNTSIFGSFLIGGLVMPTIQKRWFNVQLWGPLSFFSGKRLVPFIAGSFGFVLAILFILFWPWIGTILSWLGKLISKTPYGLDSFIFGLLEKSLIPFGLHHIFYSPFWYSSLGGDVVRGLHDVVKCASETELDLSSSSCTKSTNSLETATSVFANIISGHSLSNSMWQGDSFIGASIVSLPSNSITYKNSTSSTINIMDFLKNNLGINVGRFTQGKYPIMQFGLPAAGLAMFIAAPERNRKKAYETILPAVLSSFLMGITEPIEFLFLFAAPKLFYGFHVFLCGFSFFLMNILGAHIPSIFSGGLIELIILGIIPVSKGTQFWWYIVAGLIIAPVYFVTFYSSIKILNLETPGRERSIVDNSTHSLRESKVPEQTRKLAVALGGWNNIEKMANCASRLRYDVFDKSKVNEQALKDAGIIACKWVGDCHLQAIVGPKAESINQEMIKWNGEDLGVDDF